MTPPLIVLQRSCATCAHFDGDGFCALPKEQRVHVGAYIKHPARLVCDQHAKAEEQH
jgi:hypothetical protein